MAKFEALDVAMQLARQVGPLLTSVRKHDRDLAEQLRRACTSAASCLAEDNQRRGGDRTQLFATAGGSAAEARTQITLAAAWGFVAEDDAAIAAALADRVVAMCWRLTRPR